jgi:hypothetical protein
MMIVAAARTVAPHLELIYESGVYGAHQRRADRPLWQLEHHRFYCFVIHLKNGACELPIY